MHMNLACFKLLGPGLELQSPTLESSIITITPSAGPRDRMFQDRDACPHKEITEPDAVPTGIM